MNETVFFLVLIHSLSCFVIFAPTATKSKNIVKKQGHLPLYRSNRYFIRFAKNGTKFIHKTLCVHIREALSLCVRFSIWLDVLCENVWMNLFVEREQKKNAHTHTQNKWYTMWTESTSFDETTVSVVILPSHASEFPCAERITLCEYFHLSEKIIHWKNEEIHTNTRVLTHTNTHTAYICWNNTKNVGNVRDGGSSN